MIYFTNFFEKKQVFYNKKRNVIVISFCDIYMTFVILTFFQKDVTI
jgi:hypothetical protein